MLLISFQKRVPDIDLAMALSLTLWSTMDFAMRMMASIWENMPRTAFSNIVFHARTWMHLPLKVIDVHSEQAQKVFFVKKLFPLKFRKQKGCCFDVKLMKNRVESILTKFPLSNRFSKKRDSLRLPTRAL